MASNGLRFILGALPRTCTLPFHRALVLGQAWTLPGQQEKNSKPVCPGALAGRALLGGVDGEQNQIMKDNTVLTVLTQLHVFEITPKYADYERALLSLNWYYIFRKSIMIMSLMYRNSGKLLFQRQGFLPFFVLFRQRQEAVHVQLHS